MLTKALIGMVLMVAGSSSRADDMSYQRMLAARNAVLEIAVNPEEFAGRRFEGICPIQAIDVNMITCTAFNTSGADVGSLIVSMDLLPSKQSVDLINRCAGTEQVKPDCVVYFRGKVDEDGYVHAIRTEPAGKF